VTLTRGGPVPSNVDIMLSQSLEERRNKKRPITVALHPTTARHRMQFNKPDMFESESEEEAAAHSPTHRHPQPSSPQQRQREHGFGHHTGAFAASHANPATEAKALPSITRMHAKHRRGRGGVAVEKVPARYVAACVWVVMEACMQWSLV